MTIRLLNSLSGRVEALKTRIPSVISWYACGPTVYDDPHLGHARTYITQDIVRRILETYGGYQVRLQMGITDLDDKIIGRAAKENISWEDLASKYTTEFMHMLHLLNIKFPSRFSFVSASIGDIGDFVEQLLRNGYAYGSPSGSVYFSIDDYESAGFKYGLFRGALSCNEEADATEKRSSRDFALWKARKSSSEPAFDALGVTGRPGWHVECSAMSTTISVHKGLGSIDLHSGGKDLRFPHHENEIAQSQAFYNRPGEQWCSHFLHIGHVKINGDKMSKSLGNFISVKDFLRTESADVLRMMCLLKPYAEDFEFNRDMVDASKRTLHQIRSGLNALEQLCASTQIQASDRSSDWDAVKKDIECHLMDDIGTSQTIRLVTWWLANLKKHDRLSLNHSLHDIRAILHVLGMRHVERIEDDNSTIHQFIQFRSAVRAVALKTKDQELLRLCDQARQGLTDLEISVQDGKNK